MNYSKALDCMKNCFEKSVLGVFIKLYFKKSLELKPNETKYK